VIVLYKLFLIQERTINYEDLRTAEINIFQSGYTKNY